MPMNSDPTNPPALRRFTIALAAIVAVAAVLSINRLGAADVCGFNEAVEGVFVQQMVEHGEILFPVENGRAPLYKPPLFHWTATGVDRLIGAGRVTPFNLRMTSALYAIAGVVLTMGFAYSLFGLGGALVAGAVLCGSYQYIENARIGRVDMTLCFFETLALFAFAWWITAKRRNDVSLGGTALRYLFGAALGLAVLSKGPIGAILPAIACCLFVLIDGRTAELRRLAVPLLLAIAIGASWYAACYFSGRYGFLQRQLGSENFGRFFGSLGAMAPWYYIKPLLLNSVPLSLIVPFTIYAALRTYRDPEPSSANRATVAARLFAIFWIVTVVFFSIAAYKRRTYLLPLWPASALMIAWWLESIESSRDRVWKTTPLVHLPRTSILVICAGAIVFNLIYLPRKAIDNCGDDSMRTTAAEINRIVGRDEPLYSYGLGEEPATLLFYLDRNAPPIVTRLGDAPPGYIIVPEQVWRAEKESAPEWTPVFESITGNPRVVLLHYGAALALSERAGRPLP
jgi:4-amino-4-deoxy-L-arabinose transferase-like glycosyltransferase